MYFIYLQYATREALFLLYTVPTYLEEKNSIEKHAKGYERALIIYEMQMPKICVNNAQSQG